MPGPEVQDPRGGHADERELYLNWLRYLRGAVLRNTEGLSDEQARWTPDGALIPIIGIVNHLTRASGGRSRVACEAKKSTEAKRSSGRAGSCPWKKRSRPTENVPPRPMLLSAPCRWGVRTDLRFVLSKMVNEIRSILRHERGLARQDFWDPPVDGSSYMVHAYWRRGRNATDEERLQMKRIQPRVAAGDNMMDILEDDLGS